MDCQYVVDVTRLFARMRRPAATGIDRVLLEYALAFDAYEPGRALFCAWVDGRPRRIPDWLVQGLLDHLSDRWLGESSLPVATPCGRAATRRVSPGRVRVLRSAFRRRRVTEVLLRAGTPLERRVRHDRPTAYLNVSHKNLAGIERVRRMANGTPLKSVVMIHDLLPTRRPELFSSALAAEFEQGLRSTLELGDLVLTNSEQTARELTEWASERGLPTPAVEAIPLGGTRRRRRDAPGPAGAAHTPGHFVFLGTLERRKNVELLVRVWERLQRDLGEPPRLALLGSTSARTRLPALQNGLSRSVQLREGLNDRQVRTVLQGARALLLPSRAEGFGLPVAEALSLGVPVLCSDLPALRESGRGIPDYLPVDDPDAWHEAVRDYSRADSPRRAEQLARLSAADVPSWEDHFGRLRDVLSAAL